MSTQFAPVWNNASVDFSCIKANVTDSNSGSNSTLLDLQVGGVSKFKIAKDSSITTSTTNTGIILDSISAGYGTARIVNASGSIAIYASAAGLSNGSAVQIHWLGAFGVPSTGFYGWLPGSDLTAQADSRLYRDAAGILAQRNGTSAQTFRLYKTWANNGVDYERGVLDWQTTADVFRIGTEAGGTGTVRNIALVGGNVGIGTTSPALKMHVVDSTTSGNLLLENTIASGYASIQFKNNNNQNFFMGVGGTSGGQFPNHWYVTTAGSQATSIIFTSNGSLGLGTNTTTGYKFNIDAGGDRPIRITSSNADASIDFTNTSTGGRRFNFGSTGSSSAIGAGFAIFDSTAYDAGGISLSVATRFKIDSSGNIGLSNLSPAAKLDISDTTGAGSGSLQASALNIAQTWSTTGTPTAFKLNVTDTASNPASLLMDLQCGNKRLTFAKNGILSVIEGTRIDLYDSSIGLWASGAIILRYGNNAVFAHDGSGAMVRASDFIGFAPSSAANGVGDVRLYRDSANTLAQRNDTNAQTFRLYRTYTNGSNYAFTAAKQDATTGYILDSVNAGTGSEPTNLLDLQLNSVSKFKVDKAGKTTTTNLEVNNNGLANNARLLLYSQTGAANGDPHSSIIFQGNLYGTNDYFEWSSYRGSYSLNLYEYYYGTTYNAFSLAAGNLTLGVSSNLYLSTSGFCGMGTTSPTSKLHIVNTWNNAGTTFTHILANVTDTNSNAASLLMDLQVGGVSKFSVDKNGNLANSSNVFQLGGGDVASPVSQTLRVSSVLAGTSNANSADWTLQGSLPTGTGTSGKVVINNSFKGLSGNSTVTISIASPAVITWTNHLSVPGQAIQFSTTGQLPTGITAGVTYYVMATGLAGNHNQFQISAVGPLGPAVNTSGTQSGTHTGTWVTNVQNPSLPVALFGPCGIVGSGTTHTPALELRQFWQQTSGTCRGLRIAVCDTNSNGGNLLECVYGFDPSFSGSPGFRVDSANRAWCSAFISSGYVEAGSLGFFLRDDTQPYRWGGNDDVLLFRDAASILALRRANAAGPTTYPQAFRLYNSVDGTNAAPGSNWERAKIAWSSNVLQIGTEKLGTGSARALELQTDGTTRLTIGATGNGNATFTGSVTANSAGLVSSGSGYEVALASNFASSNPGVGTVSNHQFCIYTNSTKRLQIESNGTAVTFSDAVHIAVGATTGTKIGTATTQKLGFFNSTPVVQPAAVADATDAASVITQLNLLLARMRDLGLIAT